MLYFYRISCHLQVSTILYLVLHVGLQYVC